jgi:hypothetical protein
VDRAKALDRVRKLLRTAAPNSGASDNERSTAAMQAVELMSTHNLTVEPEPPPPERRRRPPPQQAPTYSPPTYAPPRGYYHGSNANWTEVTMQTSSTCGACGCHLFEHHLAFYDSQLGYRCHDITCTE